MYFTAVHLVGVRFTGVHLTGVYLLQTCISNRHAPRGRADVQLVGGFCDFDFQKILIWPYRPPQAAPFLVLVRPFSLRNEVVSTRKYSLLFT
jgi:hypothetical protein